MNRYADDRRTAVGILICVIFVTTYTQLVLVPAQRQAADARRWWHDLHRHRKADAEVRDAGDRFTGHFDGRHHREPDSVPGHPALPVYCTWSAALTIEN